MHFKFLSKDYPIEKAFFFISRLCLGWLGEFPQNYSSNLRIVNFTFHSIVLFGTVICQFCYGFYYISEDLQSGLDALCPAISCMASFFKMLLIYWYGKDLNVLFKHLQHLFFAGKDAEKKSIAKRFSIIATKLSFMVFIAATLATLFYGLRPLLTNLIRVMLGMPYIFDDTSLRVLVPTITLRLPWYPLTYALIAYAGAIVGLAFTGVGGFYVSFCLSSAALFKMLQADIRNSLEKFEKKPKLTMEENEICCQKLGRIVERHNELIDLINQFSRIFTWVVLSHFVIASLEIGASIIEVILYPGYRSIVYITYTMAALSELYTYCYSASVMTENSIEIGNAAYLSSWHNCDSRVKNIILLIIMRSQKPVTLDVPFFSPNLETFMSIVQTAGSLITVAKSFF